MKRFNLIMILEDDFNRILLDKLIQNVISCLPIIENISQTQDEQIKEFLNVTNRRDFVLGALWCTILEKFLVNFYLYTGKTITNEQGLEISQYVIEKIKHLYETKK